METSLADQDRAITILPVEDLLTPVGPATDPVPTRSPRAVSRRAGLTSFRRPAQGQGRRQGAGREQWRRPRRLLPRPRLEPPERRPRRDRRRPGRGHERRRLSHPRAAAAALRHRPALHRRPAGAAGSRPHHRQGLRDEPPAEPRRAAAQEQQEGHRLHHLAGARLAEPCHRRDAVLQGSHPGRAARGTRAAARPARRARRDGGGDCARGQEPARRHRSHGRHSQAHAAGVEGRPDDPRRHHQGSQDGQRHRPRGARFRPSDPAAGRAHVGDRGDQRRHRPRRGPRAEGQRPGQRLGAAGTARSRATRTRSGRCSPTSSSTPSRR